MALVVGNGACGSTINPFVLRLAKWGSSVYGQVLRRLLSWLPNVPRLTDEQRARCSEFADQWTKIALCTDPADRPRAEAAIREIYRQGGLQPPSTIVWCGSPFSQCLTRAIILDRQLIKKTLASLRPASGLSSGPALPPTSQTAWAPPSRPASASWAASSIVLHAASRHASGVASGTASSSRSRAESNSPSATSKTAS
jgi:hypothetical protein